MSSVVFGIDTGGTFTDAVCVDSSDGRVIAAVKTPTSHHHLAAGIAAALSKLCNHQDVAGRQVAAIGLSTTLATNSVVEQRGARVALFVIGYVKQFKIPVTALIYLHGGHRIDGSEEEELELDGLVNSLGHLKGEVDAYAVCSALSMVNPTHELVAEKAISLIDPKPVFCSHRASGRAGMKERAATAALHATLMPLMKQFLGGVNSAMAERHLSCPLLIVSGDGNAATPDDAVNRSGTTVASGPACTALFGARQGIETCLVVDIGGTTTDIVLIENGAPTFDKNGCTIGSWTTHMTSVDMLTGGVGGDSLVKPFAGSFTVGPGRVMPLCLTAALPSCRDRWSGFETDGRLVQINPSLSDDSRHVHGVMRTLLHSGPTTLRQLGADTGMSIPVLESTLDELARQQQILVSGFTPTDALHLLGHADFGSATHSFTAAAILGSPGNLDVAAVGTRVIELTQQQIIDFIITYLSRRCWGQPLTPFLATHNNRSFLELTFRLTIPIIGLGAAARFFLPGIAEKLQTTVHFPEHHEVGNGIGAAISVLTSSLISGTTR